MSEDDININSDDTDLIESFKNGNRTAFNYLVLKYHKKIYWVIRRMVIDHDDADDITQEVFIKIYRSLNDFRGESKFFTYIYKIAVNYSLNHIKRKKTLTGRTSDFEAEAYKLESNDKKSDEIFDDNKRTILLEQAIFSLPPQQRAVFNLRFYNNLPYEDISKILKKSVGGLKANYFHAIKKIEEFLKNKKSFNY